MKVINFLLIIIIVIFSCNEPSSVSKDENFFDFTEPNIDSVKPKSGQEGVDPQQKIEIKFSEKMDKKSVEQAFALISVSGGGNQEGIFSWDGDNTMIYSPKVGWTVGEDYQIGLSTSAKDVNRNHLLKSLISYFYIGDDHANPYVTTRTETENPYVRTNQVIITIYFSKDMDETSLLTNINLPGVNYWTELNGNVLTITSRDDLPSGGTYTLTISKEAKSTTGLKMVEDYTYEFAMIADMILPEISFIKDCTTENVGAINGIDELINDKPGTIQVNDDTITFNGKIIDNCFDLLEGTDPNSVQNKDSIIIVFSEPMNRTNTETAININPAIDYSPYWMQSTVNGNLCDVLILRPSIGFEQGKEYTFNINSTAQDLAGNEMQDDQNYYLVPSTLPPKATRVVFEQPGCNPQEIEIDVSGEGYTNDIPNLLISEMENEGVENGIRGNITIRVYFADAVDQEFEKIEPQTFYKNIGINYIIGYKKSTPTFILFSRNTDDHYFEVEFTGLYYNATEDNNRYTFYINGGPTGVVDEDGNYMEKEKIEVTFIVTGILPVLPVL